MIRDFLNWFYDELPAYYSIPVSVLIVVLIFKGLF